MGGVFAFSTVALQPNCCPNRCPEYRDLSFLWTGWYLLLVLRPELGQHYVAAINQQQ